VPLALPKPYPRYSFGQSSAILWTLLILQAAHWQRLARQLSYAFGIADSYLNYSKNQKHFRNFKQMELLDEGKIANE
jgi:hypothetical protein